MAQVKKAVLDLVEELPADCTLEDVQYQLYVRQRSTRSMQAAASGRVTSHEQVKKRLSKWLAQIIWSDPAVDDLEAAVEFIGKDSDAYARSLAQLTVDAAESLRDLPQSRPPPA